MLGLGLRISTPNRIATSLVRLTGSSTMLLNTMKANGVVPGVNAPFTNPIVDLANQVGKNLFNGFLEIGAYTPSTIGVVIAKSTNALNIRCSTGISVLPDTTYTLKNFDGYTDFRFWLTDENDIIEYSEFIGTDTKTFTTTANTKKVYFRVSGGTQPPLATQVQLELGSTATAYEPYARNDATLVNFSATTGSGYDEVLAPNGKLVTMLKPEGVDDYGILPNSPDLDPTGLDDFGMAFVIRTGSTLQNATIICKAEGDGTTIQYELKLLSDGRIRYTNGGSIRISGGLLATDTFYKIILTRKNTNIILKANATELTASGGQSLVSRANTRLMATPDSADGLSHANFFNGHLGIASFTLNPTEQWENSFNQLANQTYGL